VKEKVIHPGSRKAAKMMREVHRLEKKERFEQSVRPNGESR